MARNRVFSVVVILLLSSMPVFARSVVAVDPSNVVIIAPKEAPVSIASVDGFSDAKKLYVSVAFRNETEGAINGASVAMMVFDARRNVIAAATHRAAGYAHPGKTFSTELELPLMKPVDAAWQVMVVPVEAWMAEEQGWRLSEQGLRPLVERLRGSQWTGAQQALALGADLIPGGERVQMLPPNCTLQQCGANNHDCYYHVCYDLIACAYCDRRRTDEGCSTTCYCIGPTMECPPDPYQ